MRFLRQPLSSSHLSLTLAIILCVSCTICNAMFLDDGESSGAVIVNDKVSDTVSAPLISVAKSPSAPETQVASSEPAAGDDAAQSRAVITKPKPKPKPPKRKPATTRKPITKKPITKKPITKKPVKRTTKKPTPKHGSKKPSTTKKPAHKHTSKKPSSTKKPGPTKKQASTKKPSSTKRPGPVKTSAKPKNKTTKQPGGKTTTGKPKNNKSTTPKRNKGKDSTDDPNYCKTHTLEDGCFKTPIVGKKGDSGGPVVCETTRNNWAVTGIVSYGTSKCNGKSRYGWHGVYTDILQVRQALDKLIRYVCARSNSNVMCPATSVMYGK
ncbi:hypothetical protein GZH46_01168 [Fragariocoptes setiger]|uniref:Peptidase S1 domain-containing protein n=1 Tax=Fragariocoptes setiger TaxID=1670756 RepID=A0ABQ7SA34_9ACAR|nr:hypothetical protein GZH46_01168 [Fragariocoptes setiger]